jgi:hypothetical protein
MVNSLLNAITKQLGTKFGTTYHYYMEDFEQNFTKPCFTVDMRLPVQRSRSPVSYDRTMPVVIHYFTNNEKTKKRELYDMAEQIFECLEYLNYQDGLIRGEDISWRITEGVLQFFITYEFKTTRIDLDQDQMETLEESNSLTTN